MSGFFDIAKVTPFIDAPIQREKCTLNIAENSNMTFYK